MADQMMLFTTEQVAHGDGSFTVKPKRLVDGREIDAAKAAAMLGFKDKESVFRLIETGEIKGWKPQTLRGNGKYRIDLGSVLAYKERRLAESRSA